MDTFCFGTISPNIFEKYPETSVTFAVKAISRPSVTVLLGQLYAQGEFDLSILIPEDNGSEVTVAKLSMFVGIGVTASIISDRLVGAVDVPQVRITEKKWLKEFAPYMPQLNVVLQLILEVTVAPMFNYYGAMGYAMHFPNNVNLVNTEIVFKRGIFQFNTDSVKIQRR